LMRHRSNRVAIMTRPWKSSPSTRPRRSPRPRERRHRRDHPEAIPEVHQEDGFGPHLFDAWRFLDIGEPGMDLTKRRPNPTSC
jgi:hypothetical protein